MLNIKMYLLYKGEVDLTNTHFKSITVEGAKQIYEFNVTIWGGTKEKKRKKKKKKKEEE